ncbi:uncharacterized protein LOC119685238 [Teleopsis dalmanni]|uniref:uncharacterized protein LOC119685238 n=1 Tax=Teleopsis dalmanni TaxID=139649 RepID=UPI0018CE3E0C|nr:uncharacterized protein LOC119685238 [Teleopsis dalmanni]XP_037955402.1 uncharacterized protein LOC119685238 [Teleopsis dalmanni]
MALNFIFNLIKTYGVSKVQSAIKETDKDVGEYHAETEKYEPPIAGKSKTKIGSKKQTECKKKHSDQDRKKENEITINRNSCDDFKTERRKPKKTSDLKQNKKSGKKRRKMKKISNHHSGCSDTSVHTICTKSSSTGIRFCTCDEYKTTKNRPKKQTPLKQKKKSAKERRKIKKISNLQSYDTSVHTACTSSSETETSFCTCDEFITKKTRSNKRTPLKQKKKPAKERRKMKKISTILSENSDTSLNVTCGNSPETDICTCGKEQRGPPTTTKRKQKNLNKYSKRTPMLATWDGCKRSRKKKRARKCPMCRLSH